MSVVRRFRPRPIVGLLALALAFTAGCASQPWREQRISSIGAEPRPYMRVVRPDTNTIALQIALRRFVPSKGRGPDVWLTGASHLGESNYFARLQRHLGAQSLVLYEGVGGKSKGRMRFDPAEESSIQHTMAAALGLVFQLSAIDYDRPQFRNSDLTIPQLQRLLSGEAADAPGTGAGGTGGGREFQELMGVMDGSSVLGTLMHLGFKLIGGNPKLRAMTKVVMIETLGQLTGDMARMKGMPPEIQRLLEVIIQERNKVVLHDLRQEVLAPRPVRAMSVFYGAGHMADLEKRLRSELGYRPRSEIWLTAMAVDLRQAGLAPAEMEMMRGLIRWQLDALKGE